MRKSSLIRVLLAALYTSMNYFTVSLRNPDSALAQLRNPHGEALVIGKKHYSRRIIPDVTFACQTTMLFGCMWKTISAFIRKTSINIEKRAQLFCTFGRNQGKVSDLLVRLLPDSDRKVVLYKPGHGTPSLRDGNGRLLPADISPRKTQEEGLPLELLRSAPGDLSNTKRLQLNQSVCFSGAGDGGRLVRSASHVIVRPALPRGLAGKVSASALDCRDATALSAYIWSRSAVGSVILPYERRHSEVSCHLPSMRTFQDIQFPVAPFVIASGAILVESRRRAYHGAHVAWRHMQLFALASASSGSMIARGHMVNKRAPSPLDTMGYGLAGLPQGRMRA